MTLRIYNTMSRKPEPFVPLEPGKVNMYVCGPTVYDYIHIGNARPLIFFDVVRRYLEYAGYDVNFIVNYTDVDDKMIRKAEQEGSTVPEIAERFIAAYEQDWDALGAKPPTVAPRVTDTMEEIITLISNLADSGLAYEDGGDVYFRTSRFPEYGKLSHKNLDELQYGIRIEVDRRKENPQDFVLWKATKPGEIHWSSPWGDGRPGWHIECSAIALRHAGKTLDIHGGGQDLTFPHHECEIAQSESLTGEPLARYWMHNGFVNIDNEKMSKSLGNGVNVREILKRTSAQAVRYLMLSAHYRSPLNFSDEIVRQAESSVGRLATCRDNLKHRLAAVHNGLPHVSSEGDTEVLSRLEALREEFEARMNDDFSTPDAITVWFQVVSEANAYLQRPVAREAVLQQLLNRIAAMDTVLCLLPPEAAAGLLDEEADALIAERIKARRSRNFVRADEIRDLLAKRGILLEDTPQGIRWKRK